MFFKNKRQFTLGDAQSSLTIEEIVQSLKEPRPLPMGMSEFEEWSARIISRACLPPSIKIEGLKMALAHSLTNIPSTQDHECDGYFIKILRKSAVNQIALAKVEEWRMKGKERMRLELAEEEKNKGEDIAVTSNVTVNEKQEILHN